MSFNSALCWTPEDENFYKCNMRPLKETFCTNKTVVRLNLTMVELLEEGSIKLRATTYLVFKV